MEDDRVVVVEVETVLKVLVLAFIISASIGGKGCFCRARRRRPIVAAVALLVGEEVGVQAVVLLLVPSL